MASKGMKSQVGKKGSEGKGTGATTRKAINSAVKRGNTHEQIGKSTNRSGSTISKIASGEIKNPPKGVSTKINKISSKKK